MNEKRSCCCGVLSPLWWWLLTLIGLALLFAFMITKREPVVENDLAARTNDQLAVAGLNWAQADLTKRGRDVLLTGQAPDVAAQQKALDVARSVYGVRMVEAKTTVADAGGNTAATTAQAPDSKQETLTATASTTAAAPTSSTSAVDATTPNATNTQLLASLNNGKLTLEGTLPNQVQLDAVVNAANQQVGAANVINHLTVASAEPTSGTASTAPAPSAANTADLLWVDSMPRLLAVVPETGTVAIEEGTVTVTGVVPNDTERDTTIARVNEALVGSDLRLIDHLRVDAVAGGNATTTPANPADATTPASTPTATATTTTDTTTDSAITPTTEPATGSDVVSTPARGNRVAVNSGSLSPAAVDGATTTTSDSNNGNTESVPDGDSTATSDVTNATATPPVDGTADTATLTPAEASTNDTVDPATANPATTVPTVNAVSTTTIETPEVTVPPTADPATVTTAETGAEAVPPTAATDPVASIPADAPATTARGSDVPVASTTTSVNTTTTTPAETVEIVENGTEPAVADDSVRGITPVTEADRVAVSCQSQLDGLMAGKQILFATNKAEINRNSRRLLDQVASLIKTCESSLVNRGMRVSGHTDNIGDSAYNVYLSQQRADAVKTYLMSKGVKSGLIEAVGYGASQPIASNDTPQGRSQNRRITFDIKQN